RRPRLRTEDRRGQARRDPAASRRDPRVPGHGGTRGGGGARGGGGTGGRPRPPRAGVLMAPILEVEDLHVAYGATRVLHGIAFRVEAGGITTILGANGAGKTTTLRAVCGMARPVGTVRLDGRRIDG